jgi:hypothetical protein
VIAGDCPQRAKFMGVVIQGVDINTHTCVFSSPLLKKSEWRKTCDKLSVVFSVQVKKFLSFVRKISPKTPGYSDLKSRKQGWRNQANVSRN